MRTGPRRWQPRLLELRGKSKLWRPLLSLYLAEWANAIHLKAGSQALGGHSCWAPPQFLLREGVGGACESASLTHSPVRRLTTAAQGAALRQEKVLSVSGGGEWARLSVKARSQVSLRKQLHTMSGWRDSLLTMGFCCSTVRSRSPCSQNSAATSRATCNRQTPQPRVSPSPSSPTQVPPFCPTPRGLPNQQKHKAHRPRHPHFTSLK